MKLAGGTSEELGFFGDLFGVTHLPAGTPERGVVICSPVYSEFLKNNRREVQLGRSLAERGFAVQRFHYRGTGNSRGDAGDLSLETMSEDAAAAVKRLSEVAGISEPDLVATRLASLAAASVAGPSSRLALWEPVVEGKRFFRDLTRSLLILGVKHGAQRSAQDLEAEFESRGLLDIAGFSVARTLRDSAIGRRLEVPEGDGAGLILQLGRSSELRRDIESAVQIFGDAGRTAEAKPLEFEEAWWFHQDVNLLRPEEGTLLDEALVDTTLEWLTGPVA